MGTSVSPCCEDSRALALDLLARSNHIAATKLQRARVQHGDFVSDQVLARRAARANLEKTIVGLRGALEASLARERYDEVGRCKLQPIETRVGSNA